jgi:hypothetical protein
MWEAIPADDFIHYGIEPVPLGKRVRQDPAFCWRGEEMD